MLLTGTRLDVTTVVRTTMWGIFEAGFWLFFKFGAIIGGFNHSWWGRDFGIVAALRLGQSLSSLRVPLETVVVVAAGSVER